MANRVTTRLRRSFVAGVILVAPLLVTAFLLNLVFGWLARAVGPLVTWLGLASYTGNIDLVARVAAIVTVVVVITFLGDLAQRGFGERVFGRLGRVMNVVPLVSVVYTSVREVADSLVERSSRYEDVVLVEYPHHDSFGIGFVTSESPPSIDEAVEGPSKLVYLPNSPNPTGGRLLVVPEQRLRYLDMSVRRALRTTITTGMATEEQLDALPDD